MNKDPLVSICCITYNHEDFISDTIEGFLKQETDFQIEIIIHDDASTDNTANIIRKYSNENPELIKPIFQKENQFSKGISPSPNFVWPKARGKFLTFCEGDDYWTDPLKLQKQADYMESNPDVVLTYHHFKNINSSEKKLENFYEPIDIPLLRPRTLTLMIKNLMDEYPLALQKAPNGDQALKFFLSTKGESKSLENIQPSVRRIHSGGLMSMEYKKNRKLRGLQTWMAIHDAYSETEYSKELENKVMRFKSSIAWGDFSEKRTLVKFIKAVTYDVKNGLILSKFKNLFLKYTLTKPIYHLFKDKKISEKLR